MKRTSMALLAALMAAATSAAGAVECRARGRLTGRDGMRGAAYELVSRVDGNAFSIGGKCDADARFVLPLVATAADRVELADGRVRIRRGDAVVTVESDLPFELAKTDRGERTFSPIAGFLYAYLTVPIRAGRAFHARIAVG